MAPSPRCPHTKLDFDLNYVIQKAGLRRMGLPGAASLVEALRNLGYNTQLEKRTCRMLCFEFASPNLDVPLGYRYVKEQEQYALNINGGLTSLYLDKSWAQILERAHKALSASHPTVKNIERLRYTFKSQYITQAVSGPDTVQKESIPKVVSLIERLIDDAPKPGKWKQHSPPNLQRNFQAGPQEYPMPFECPQWLNLTGTKPPKTLGGRFDVAYTLSNTLKHQGVQAAPVFRPFLKTYEEDVVSGATPTVEEGIFSALLLNHKWFVLDDASHWSCGDPQVLIGQIQSMPDTFNEPFTVMDFDNTQLAHVHTYFKRLVLTDKAQQAGEGVSRSIFKRAI